jgi:hypothetical protein
MRRSLGLVLTGVSALLLLLADAAVVGAQCAMCRTALTQSPEGQQMAAGFNSGILFLRGMPYLVFAAVAGSLIWMRRRSERRHFQAPGKV